MKKYLPILILVALCANAWGQATDTVYNRSTELYYSEWYDTSINFYDSLYPNCLENLCLRGIERNKFMAIPDYTSRPLKVTGLAVMHTIDYNEECLGYNNIRCLSFTRLPEYLYLYQLVADSLVLLKEVRWDTATPQLLQLPRNIDTGLFGFEYCYLYRIPFDTSITVDSSFYIGGSYYNNRWNLNSGAYDILPTCYVGIGGLYRTQRYHTKKIYSSSFKGPWTFEDPINEGYGPFFAMTTDTSVVLSLSVSDTAMGTVQGGGHYLDSSYVTISAIPKHGYKFSHWNDGNIANPRIVLLVKDTAFTAYFTDNDRYTVATDAQPELGGTVSGGGTYFAFDTVTLTATPNLGYAFVQWTDSLTSATRQHVVTNDTAFTAVFSPLQSIGSVGDVPVLTLTPNPARGSVSVGIDAEAAASGAVLAVVDASGREVLRQPLKTSDTQLDLSGLPAGLYFVTLATDKGSTARKLVVE